MISSGYTTFKSYMLKHFGTKLAKIGLSLNYPCPQQPPCLFCNQSSFIPSSLNSDGDIHAQIVKALPYLAKKYKTDRFIAYFQDNTATAAPFELLIPAVESAAKFAEVKVISLSTRPDYLSIEILQSLKKAAGDKVLWIELGMQSANDQTLEAIGRGHDFSTLIKAVEMLKLEQIVFGLQIIVGLPGERKAEIMQTFRAVNELNPDFCKIHQLQVVKGSVLEKLFAQNLYQPLEMNAYLELLSEGLSLLNSNICITRLLADAHLSELIVPRWQVGKEEFKAGLFSLMQSKSVYQGSNIE